MKTKTKKLFLSLFAFAALSITACGGVDTSSGSDDPGSNTPSGEDLKPTPTPGGGGTQPEDDPGSDPGYEPYIPPYTPPETTYDHLTGTLSEGVFGGPVFVHAYNSVLDSIQQNVAANVNENSITFALESGSFDRLIVVELDQGETSIAQDWSNVNKESAAVYLPPDADEFDFEFSFRLHPRGEATDPLQVWGTRDHMAWGKLADITSRNENSYETTIDVSKGTEFVFHLEDDPDRWVNFTNIIDTNNGQYQKFQAKGGEDPESINNIIALEDGEFTFCINKLSGEVVIEGGIPPVVVPPNCIYGKKAAEEEWKEFAPFDPEGTTPIQLEEDDLFSVHLTGDTWLNYGKVTGEDGLNTELFEARGGEENPDDIRVLKTGTYNFSLSPRGKLIIGDPLPVKNIEFTVRNCPKTYEGQDIYLLGTVNDWKQVDYYHLDWIGGDEEHSVWKGTYEFDYGTVGFKFVLISADGQTWEVNGEGNERLLTIDGETATSIELEWGKYDRALPSYEVSVNSGASSKMADVTSVMSADQNKFAEYKITLEDVEANDVLSFTTHDNDLPDGHFIFEEGCNVNPETGAVIEGGNIIVVLKLYYGDDGSTYYVSWVSDPLSTITAKLGETDLPLVDVKSATSTDFAEYHIQPEPAGSLSFKKDGQELKVTGVDGNALQPGPQSSIDVRACTGDECYKVYITNSFEIWIITPDYVDPATITAFKVAGTIGGENKWEYADAIAFVNDDANKPDGATHQWKAELDLVKGDEIKLRDGKGTSEAWIGWDNLEANDNFKVGTNGNIVLKDEEGHYDLYLKINGEGIYSIYIVNPSHVVNAYFGNEVLTPNAEMTNPQDNLAEYTLTPEADGAITIHKDAQELHITGVNGVAYGQNQPTSYDVQEGFTYGIYIKKNYEVWLTDPNAPQQVVPPCVHLGKDELWSDHQLVAIDPNAGNVEYTAVLDLEEGDVFIIHFGENDWRGYNQIKAGSPAFSKFALKGENDIEVTTSGRYRISVETYPTDGKYIWIVAENSFDAYLGETKLNAEETKSNPANYAEYVIAPTEASDLTLKLNGQACNITKVDGKTPEDPTKLTVRICEGEESYKIYVTDTLEVHIITPDYVPPVVEYRDVIIDAGSLKGTGDYIYAWVWKDGGNGQWIKADENGKITFNREFDYMIPVVSTKKLSGDSWDGVKAKSYDDIAIPAYVDETPITLKYVTSVGEDGGATTAFFTFGTAPTEKAIYLVVSDNTFVAANNTSSAENAYLGLSLKAGDYVKILEINNDGTYYYVKGWQLDPYNSYAEEHFNYSDSLGLVAKDANNSDYYLKINGLDKVFWVGAHA